MGKAKNNSTPSILYTPPGLLNKLNVSLTHPTIGKNETIYSILGKTIQKVFSPDMLATSGPLKGILLRVENNAGPASYEMGADAGGSGQQKLTKYRVRIPELHFHLKVPNSLANPNDLDNLIIDTYPIFTAKSDTIANLGYTAGQLVEVEFNSNNNREEGTFLGAINNTGPWANWHEDPTEEKLKNSAKSYDGCGATGDNYLANSISSSKMNNKLPIVFDGKGHGKVEIISGPNAKEWVVSDLKKLQKRQLFQGKIYVDRFGHNGSLDDVNMKEGTGRSTIIYMPATCTPAQPLELIYWFHDGKEFKWQEWERRLAPQLKAMEKQCRNFIFVEHEMLWSLENSDTFNGVRRLQTIETDSPNWSDREWNIWGGPGTGPKPASYKSPKYNWWQTFAAGGDLPKLYNEVLKILKNKFNVYPDKIKELTLIGHGSGGAAISVAARRGMIGPGPDQINPTKIVLSNASYSSTPQAHHLDSDIFEVFKVLDEQTKLEVHTMWHTDAPRLPIEAAATFFGGLFGSIVASGMTNFSAIKSWFSGQAHSSTDVVKWSIDGHKLIEEHKDSFFKVGPPFTNIIYKGWRNTKPEDGAKLTLKWLPPDESGIVKKNKSTDNLQSSFMGFKGDAIEYKSTHNNGRKAVILKPFGVNTQGFQPFELIYFFHGQYGNIENSLTKEMQGAISYMVEEQNRNIIVVMMDLGPKPDTGLVWDGTTNNNFNAFHNEVSQKIKEEWNTMGFGFQPINISFITIKAFDTGGAAARRAIKNMTSEIKEKLKRIDFLEASYGYEDAIINNFNNYYNLQFGNKVEFILVANPDFRKEDGDNSPWNRIKQYEGESGPSGIIAIESNNIHKKIPSSYFSLKSILFPGDAPLVSLTETKLQQETPALIYDKEGKAFNPLTLEPVAKYDKPVIPHVLPLSNENQLPCPMAPEGYKQFANEAVRGYGFLKTIKFLPIANKRVALEDKYTGSGKIKSYGSHTNSKLYNEHIKQQLDIAKKQHLTTPSLEQEKSYHKGVNNIIWRGKPFLTETPFKVVRYDGTAPGYKRMIGERAGMVTTPGFDGPKIINKYWFDWNTFINEDPLDLSVYSSKGRALQFLDNGEYYRSKKQIPQR